VIYRICIGSETNIYMILQYIYEEILPKKSWEANRKGGNKKNKENICHKSRFEFKKIKYNIFA